MLSTITSTQQTDDMRLQGLLAQLTSINSTMKRSNRLCEQINTKINTVEKNMIEYDRGLNKVLESIHNKQNNFFYNFKRVVLYSWKRKQKPPLPSGGVTQNG